jgi:hypothetical protein
MLTDARRAAEKTALMARLHSGGWDRGEAERGGDGGAEVEVEVEVEDEVEDLLEDEVEVEGEEGSSGGGGGGVCGLCCLLAVSSADLNLSSWIIFRSESYGLVDFPRRISSFGLSPG